MCETGCYMCLWTDYRWNELITLDELKQKIENKSTIYTLEDYADRRKSTNITRFEYCPCCGEKINWKSIKE